MIWNADLIDGNGIILNESAYPFGEGQQGQGCSCVPVDFKVAESKKVVEDVGMKVGGRRKDKMKEKRYYIIKFIYTKTQTSINSLVQNPSHHSNLPTTTFPCFKKPNVYCRGDGMGVFCRRPSALWHFCTDRLMAASQQEPKLSDEKKCNWLQSNKKMMVSIHII